MTQYSKEAKTRKNMLNDMDFNHLQENIKKILNKGLDYLIDPTFTNINRLFLLLFKNGNNNPTRNSFDKYYMPLVEIQDFIALINNKPFFDQPVKNKQEAYEKLIEMSRNYVQHEIY